MSNVVPFVAPKHQEMYEQAIRWMVMGTEAEAAEWLLQAPQHVEVTLNILTVNAVREIAVEEDTQHLMDSGITSGDHRRWRELDGQRGGCPLGVDVKADYREITEGRTEEERAQALELLARWYAEQSLKMRPLLHALRGARSARTSLPP